MHKFSNALLTVCLTMGLILTSCGSKAVEEDMTPVPAKSCSRSESISQEIESSSTKTGISDSNSAENTADSGDVKNAETEEVPLYGVVTGNVYSNSFFGISADLTGYKVSDDTNLADMGSVNKDDATKNLVTNGGTLLDLYAEDNTNTEESSRSLNVAVTANLYGTVDDTTAAKDVADQMAGVLESSGASSVVSKAGTVDFLGHSSPCVRTHMLMGNVFVCETQVFLLTDDYSGTITAAFNEPDNGSGDAQINSMMTTTDGMLNVFHIL